MSHTEVPAGPGVPPAPVGPSTGRAPDGAPERGPGTEPRPGSTTLLRAAVRPRMLVLLVLLLGAAAVCVRLGAWQLDRAEIRGESAAVRELAAREAAEPVGLGTVLSPQTTFTGELVGRRVTAQGFYDAAGQLLVRDREHDGRTGYLVLTPLRVTDDDPPPGAVAGTAETAGTTGTADASAATAPVLAVVRGWVATPDDADALAVPTGPVTVTGYLQVTEAGGGGGLPAGQVDAISAPDLLNMWGGPIWTGYLVLIDSEPAQAPGLASLPAPTRAGAGLNLQNLAYAAQWWIFGGFALFLWVRLVRDEAAGPWADDDPPQADDGPPQA